MDAGYKCWKEHCRGDAVTWEVSEDESKGGSCGVVGLYGKSGLNILKGNYSDPVLHGVVE